MAAMDVVMHNLKYIQKLLDECERASPDCFGFIHYIEKEVYDDARREFSEWLRATSKRQDT